MSVTRLAFKLEDGHNYIDLAKALSMYQRTLIRQKQNFTVLGAQIVDNSDLTAKISTAPNTWYVRAAINRCFRAWKNQRYQTLQNIDATEQEENVGKFADFKISLNGANPSLTRDPIWTDNPAQSLSTLAPAREWVIASVTDETAPASGGERHFKIVGDHDNTWYGATKGWLETRPLPDDTYEPEYTDLDGDNVTDAHVDFLNNLNQTEDGNETRIGLLYDDNDNAPYAVTNVYGNYDDDYNLQLQSLVIMNATASGATSQMIAGFKALCGLIHVHIQNGSGPVLFIDVMNTPEAF